MPGDGITGFGAFRAGQNAPDVSGRNAAAATG